MIAGDNEERDLEHGQQLTNPDIFLRRALVPQIPREQHDVRARFQTVQLDNGAPEGRGGVVAVVEQGTGQPDMGIRNLGNEHVCSLVLGQS